MSHALTNPVEPLLKWPGGKRKLAKLIASHFPEKYGTYYEPFFGGGAIFFRLNPPRAVLADANPNLMACYQAVRDDPERVIAALARMPNGAENYLRIRSSRPVTVHAAAARLIYLCTYSFNGIYRENLRGEYNVPYGHKVNHQKPSPAQIRAVATTLRHTQLVAGDFAATTSNARAGDLAYFDPPYTLRHNNNGFVKYNASLFTWRDQERLAKQAATLAERGVHVAVSNACHELIRSLYQGFTEIIIERHSVIAAAASKRSQVSESLFLRVGQ